jgi:protein TonB
MKWLAVILLFILFAQNLKAQALRERGSSKEDYSAAIRDLEHESGPDFPGGPTAWSKFLSKNLKRPNADDVQGRVIINFIIEKDGRLTNLKIVRKLFPAFDAEALRVMKLSPRWIPLKKDGKPIRSEFTIPINFTIAE